MAIPWEPHVQKSGQLTVFPADAFLRAPAWGLGLFQRILFEFNRLAQANTLGVRVAPSTQEPQRNGLGANVRMDVTSGPCSFFNAAGKDERASINVSPGHIMGFCFRPISYAGPNAIFDFSWKAFVFLPINPTVGDSTVGVSVRMAVALHELIHACGLSEDDPGHGQPNHPAPGPLDLFATDGRVLEGTDRLFLPDGKTVPDRSGQFTITTRTAMIVQSVWLLGRQ